MDKNEYKKLKNAKLSKYLKALNQSYGYQIDHTSGSHLICEARFMPVLSIPKKATISPGVWRNLGKLMNLV